MAPTHPYASELREQARVIIRQQQRRIVFGIGLQVAIPDDGHRAIVDQGPPVRACLRKRGRGKIIGHLRPAARRFVEFINTGSRESEMEPDGLVRDACAAKIVPVYTDKKRSNANNNTSLNNTNPIFVLSPYV
jgi:hypothetical protein